MSDQSLQQLLVTNFGLLPSGYTGSRGDDGYTGSSGLGYTGSRGETGLGFSIAKSYLSVSALTADTNPTGIVSGQFAIIETGNVDDAENSRLYLWNGSAYSYVNDLSGAVGITGAAGFTGSAGINGFTGSAGIGFTGSAGTAGAVGFTGSAGTGGGSGNTSIYSRTSITATAGQTSFAVAYNVGYIEVYFNGALLNAVDYTATNGSTVVLTDASADSDIVEFITYNVVPVTDVPNATFNRTNITANLAITAGYSAVSVGPINIADGVQITIADGQKWVIL